MKIVVDDGVRERSYPFEGDWTNREHMTVKRICGLRPTEYEEGLQSRDVGLAVALAVIAARRSGVEAEANDFMDLKAGSIRIEGDDDDEDSAE